MAKEFDIYLNNCLTQCDIIVYSIPYRDGLTVMNNIILKSCLNYYLLQKFVAARTESELEVHIDKMIKICKEKLSVGMRIGTIADMSAYYVLSPADMKTIFGHNNVTMTAIPFIEVNNGVEVVTDPLPMLIEESLGCGSSNMQLSQSVQKIIINSVEQFENRIGISAQVSSTFKKSAIIATNALVQMAEMTNLCYRIHNAGETAFQLAASVLATEIHFSLGKGNSRLIIGATAKDGDLAIKCETAINKLSIIADLTDTITKFMDIEDASLGIALDASPIVKRHRLLHEMDSSVLVSFDDMTLEDIDYVIIQP